MFSFLPYCRVLVILISLLPCLCFAARISPADQDRDNRAETERVEWRSFHHLTDARRGIRRAGIRDLKKYLNRFGYLPPPAANFTDTFDGNLEAAVRRYQSSHGLHDTGRLNSATLSSITTPRCGVRDFPDGAAFHTTRRYAFFPGRPRWSPSLLTYALSPNYTVDYLHPADVRLSLRCAFRRWSAVVPVTFVESDEFFSADVRIGFFSGDHGDGEPFDGVLGVLAHSFAPGNGRFHLDASERWAVDIESENSDVAVDLESVATHEIGHVLGLAHSTVKEAIMYPSLSPRTRKVDLTEDDVRGVQSLYGSNPNFNEHQLVASGGRRVPAGASVTAFPRLATSPLLLSGLLFCLICA